MQQKNEPQRLRTTAKFGKVVIIFSCRSDRHATQVAPYLKFHGTWKPLLAGLITLKVQGLMTLSSPLDGHMHVTPINN